MQIRMKLDGVPWAMAAGRALLGPVVIVGERCGWSGIALASMIVTALLSDIFDGVLARRWGCDTAGVRLFDSMSDTVFYLCVAIAICIGQPQVWRQNALLLAVLMSLEALRLVVEFAKFGRPASYHSYLAKLWGLAMTVAVVGVFARSAAGLLPLALALGVACDLEGLAMTAILPVWRRDVKSLAAAWQLRSELREQGSMEVAEAYSRSANVTRQSRFTKRPAATVGSATAATAAGAVLILMLSFAGTPAHAMERGKAAYEGGTANVPRDTVGSLDVNSPNALRFQYKKADGTPGQIEMEYAKIYGIEPGEEAVHALGLLPWVAVSLVGHPPRRYTVTIRYADADGVAQIGVFDVAPQDQRILVAIVNARSSRSCGLRTYPCPAALARR